MKLRIGVVIPTMFTKKLDRLVWAIASVQRAAKGRCVLSITVVVNQVPLDVSAEALARDISKKTDVSVEVIISHINKGFAQAVNDGMLYSKAHFNPDWYLVLNDDARVHERFFKVLVPVLHSNLYDAVSCKVLTTNGDIENVGLRYFATGIALPRQTDIQKDELPLFSGTCVLLSKPRVDMELDRHGYVFNPFFFAYAEDLELSLRIHKDGGKIYISNDALVTHEGSRTAIRGSFFQLYHGYRNIVLIIFLLWSWQQILLRLPLIVVGQLYVISMSVYKRYFLLFPKMWWWIWKNRKAILWQRRIYAKKYGDRDCV